MPRRRKSRTGKEIARLMASREDLAAVFLSPERVKGEAGAYLMRGREAGFKADDNIVACLMEFVMHDEDRHLASEETQNTLDPTRALSLFPEGGTTRKVLQWYHNDRCYAIFRDGRVQASSGDPLWSSPETEEALQEVVDLYLLRKWAVMTHMAARRKFDPQKADPDMRASRSDVAIEWEHEGGKRQPTRLYGKWSVPVVLPPRRPGA